MDRADAHAIKHTQSTSYCASERSVAMKNKSESVVAWKRRELPLLIIYAIVFYAFIIRRSLQLSRDHYNKVYGLRPGWIAHRLNDVSDAQWRNFRGNLPILTAVFGIFAFVANVMRVCFHMKARGMSYVWLLISLAYLFYLHGACTIFILSIASLNFLLVKIFAWTKYFSFTLWTYAIFFLICNRVYEGYSFSMFGQRWTYLDNFRGVFRWQICFNFVILRMISFGYDYHWACHDSHFNHEKHTEYCYTCKSGKKCYQILQGRSLSVDKYSIGMYLSYLIYAPLYIAGPIISFNAFASQLDMPQKNYSVKDVGWYGCRWISSLILLELMTHYFYYNAFAISGLWKQLSPVDVFIIGYGVLNFMWLKFFLLWRYFRLWSLICGVETPENMPKCINNCYNLETFWKSWHASYNKWLVRYIYIPLGGSRRKILNIWVVFTFVALWHDLEWKLLSWAWLTCLFYVPELVLKSAVNAFKVENALGELFFREVNAVAGAITITCLMVANLVGFVIGPSGISWLIGRFLQREGACICSALLATKGPLNTAFDGFIFNGLPILFGMLLTFYVGTKLMLHVEDVKQKGR